jgi:HPt (histidine-containing phosphotransfer) domain-containing protein
MGYTMSDSQADNQNDLLESLLGDFLDESDQLLVQLNERLLQLDEWVRALGDDHRESCDATVLNEMFRAAHSLKGLSAMLGLTDINNLTHKIENVFDAARKNELTVTRDVTELVFMGLDQLVALIDQLKDPGKGPVDCSSVLDSIRNLLQNAGAERKQTSQADAEKAMMGVGEPAPENASAAPCAPLPETDSMSDVRDEDEIPQKYLSMFLDEDGGRAAGSGRSQRTAFNRCDGRALAMCGLTPAACGCLKARNGRSRSLRPVGKRVACGAINGVRRSNRRADNLCRPSGVRAFPARRRAQSEPDLRETGQTWRRLRVRSASGEAG